MKTWIVIALAGLLFFNFSSIVSGEPFAPKVDVPKNIKPGTLDALAVMQVNAAVVPDKAVVGVPPFPDSRVVQTVSGQPATVNGKKINCLPLVKLISTAPQDKVIAFYKSHAKDYQFRKIMGGILNAFWKDRKTFNPLSFTEICTTPNIIISAIDPEEKNTLMPEAVTAIQIVYKP